MAPTLADRFWPKVEFTDDCWLWTGSKTSAGYGNIRNIGGSCSHTGSHTSGTRGRSPTGSSSTTSAAFDTASTRNISKPCRSEPTSCEALRP